MRDGVRAHLNRIDEALVLHTRALDLRRRLFGPDHAATVSSTFNIAEDYIASGRPEQAREALRELGTRIASQPPGGQAWYELKLGDIAAMERDFRGALDHHRRADAINAAFERGDLIRALAQLGIGTDLLELGRATEAVAPLDAAVALRAPFGDLAAAQYRFELGRAYCATGERARGRAEVLRARDAEVQHPGDADPALRTMAEEWLAAHP